MKQMNSNQAGMSLGILFGGWHFVWVVAVAMGFGKMWVDWVLGYHFISKNYVVGDFNLMTAVFGVVMAFIVGYVIGTLFAYIWNWVGKMK